MSLNWVASIGTGLGTLAGLALRHSVNVEPDCALVRMEDGMRDVVCDRPHPQFPTDGSFLHFPIIDYLCIENDGIYPEGSVYQRIALVAEGLVTGSFLPTGWIKIGYIVALYLTTAFVAFGAKRYLSSDADKAVSKQVNMAAWIAYYLPILSAFTIAVVPSIRSELFGTMVLATGLGLAGTVAHLSNAPAKLVNAITISSLGIGALGGIQQLNSAACHYTTAELAIQSSLFIAVSYISCFFAKIIS